MNRKNDEGKEAECPDDTPPVDMQEGVRDIKYDKNKINDEGKESGYPDDTPPVNMEEGVSNRKDENNKKLKRGKRQSSQMTLPLLIWRKV